ncbi:hypothetical protein MTQ13_04555 [Streptomyces sp. XM4011]|uniref:hypothetical protein n=1 Tax=Streptomyces TaxID=1883 RepID=UPI001FF87A85|nr:hypothetical protein [Streptomyces sp. XM4011]MCK1813555.1 hypothetical protein [Streptomyces sp. XM4011]
MPRIAAVLGTLVTAGALALGAANPALAAHGELRAGGKTYTNPSGCLNGGPIRPMTVINNTNEYAIIYDGPNCTGNVLEVVPPGGTSTGFGTEFGASVYVA